MPKKQKPKNAFFYFMINILDNHVPKPRNHQDAQEIAGRLWQTMDAKQRQPWEQKAATMRKNHEKLTTFGVPIREQQAYEQEKIGKENRMDQEIEQLVKTLSLDPQGAMSEHVFYFLHINAFVRTFRGEVVPAEIGYSEFSLRRGVSKTYSTYLDVCQIPQGYCQSAKEVARASHKIPLPEERKYLKPMETNARKVMSDLRKFCFGPSGVYEGSGQVLPTFYCVKNEIEMVRECLEKLILLSGKMIPATVHPLDNLLFHLNKYTSSLKGEQGIPTLALAIKEVEKDVYMYAPDIACNYHEEEDVTPFCSLSKVRRWGYLIADFCCKDLDIDLIPYRHCQKNAKLSHSYDAKYKNNDDWKPEMPSPAPSPALSSTSSSMWSSTNSNQKDWSSHRFSGMGRGRGSFLEPSEIEARPGSSNSSSSFDKPVMPLPRPEHYEDDHNTTEQGLDDDGKTNSFSLYPKYHRSDFSKTRYGPHIPINLGDPRNRPMIQTEFSSHHQTRSFPKDSFISEPTKFPSSVSPFPEAPTEVSLNISPQSFSDFNTPHPEFSGYNDLPPPPELLNPPLFNPTLEPVPDVPDVKPVIRENPKSPVEEDTKLVNMTCSQSRNPNYREIGKKIKSSSQTPIRPVHPPQNLKYQNIKVEPNIKVEMEECGSEPFVVERGEKRKRVDNTENFDTPRVEQERLQEDEVFNTPIKQEPNDSDETQYTENTTQQILVKQEPVSDDENEEEQPFKLIKIDLPGEETSPSFGRLIAVDIPQI